MAWTTRAGAARRAARAGLHALSVVVLAAGLPVLTGPAPADHQVLAAALTALAALVALAATGRITVATATTVVPLGHPAAAARAERAAAPRQVHPDAAGHVRSRAPGDGLSARRP